MPSSNPNDDAASFLAGFNEPRGTICIPFHAAIGGNLTNTNAPAALRFLGGVTSHIMGAPLKGFTKAALGIRRLGTAGATNHLVAVRYALTASGDVNDYSALGASGEVFCNVSGANAFHHSGWIDMDPDAAVDPCYLALVEQGGDGAADPIFGAITLWMKF